MTVAYLLSAAEKEFVWINAIQNGATNKRDPVEDKRRFIRVLEEELAEDVQDDSKDNEGDDARQNHQSPRSPRKHVIKQASYTC